MTRRSVSIAVKGMLACCVAGLLLYALVILRDRQRLTRIVQKTTEIGGSVTVESDGPTWIPKAVREQFFSRISGIDFEQTTVPEELMSDICRYSRPRHLSLVECTVPGSGLKNNLRYLDGVVWLNLDGCAIEDEDLRFIGQMKSIQWLDLNGTAVSDAGLAHLSALENLKSISLCDTPVTGHGLRSFARLTRLESLSLLDCGLDDSGFQAIGELVQLKVLRLRETPVTDKRLLHLDKLSRLERLELVDTKVTNESIGILEQFGSLKLLEISETGINLDGVKLLWKKLPECEVDWHPAEGERLSKEDSLELGEHSNKRTLRKSGL